MPVLSEGAADPGLVFSDVTEYSNSKPMMRSPAPTATPRASRLSGVVVVPMNAVMSARAGTAHANDRKAETANERSLILKPLPLGIIVQSRAQR